MAPVALLFIKAPLLLVPVPPRDKASAVPNVKPFKSKLPVPLTTVPAPVVPSGVFVPFPATPSFKTPALMVVRPV